MPKTTSPAHAATVRITNRQFLSVRRLLCAMPALVVEASGAAHVRITGSEDAFCAFAAAISDNWPVCGYRHDDRGASNRHSVYYAVETAITVPSV